MKVSVAKDDKNEQGLIVMTFDMEDGKGADIMAGYDYAGEIVPSLKNKYFVENCSGKCFNFNSEKELVDCLRTEFGIEPKKFIHKYLKWSMMVSMTLIDFPIND